MTRAEKPIPRATGTKAKDERREFLAKVTARRYARLLATEGGLATLVQEICADLKAQEVRDERSRG